MISYDPAETKRLAERYVELYRKGTLVHAELMQFLFELACYGSLEVTVSVIPPDILQDFRKTVLRRDPDAPVWIGPPYPEGSCRRLYEWAESLAVDEGDSDEPSQPN